MNNFPIYAINKFNTSDEHFYINNLKEHLEKFHFVHIPHKHDFYLCVVFTKGSGVHEIDFVEYEITSGAIFFLSPGVFHNWIFKTEMEGYIFFHSKDFYNLNYQNRGIRDFPFYYSAYNTPFLKTELNDIREVVELIELLLKESKVDDIYKEVKLCSIVDLIYIKLSKMYLLGNVPKTKISDYTIKLRQLESLVDKCFIEKKMASDYAKMLGITTRHLNRIVKLTLSKTVSMFIADRVVLEAKRLLVHSNYRVAEVADKLGFIDYSYFNRYFKKHAGSTPKEFADLYKRY